MFPTLILDAVKTIFGWIGEKSKAKHEREMAQIENQTKLLLSEQQANTNWEMAQLNDKDKLLRWAAFILFASPLLAAIINPEWGARVQSAWHLLKDWQSNVLSGMCMAVFGMRTVPQVLGATIGAIKNGLQSPNPNIVYKVAEAPEGMADIPVPRETNTTKTE